eukprot:CAMPEP_0174293060 /NCGR_PEP_ID=MMETSP0809-20121228/37356_1 /TAXON_ID=73025 ORGANISM="Eutreptiella gymnastica-like, Strain CCMP1594" /NCGR_SAMPLE_ID=MMETSP0809 /ASSEMBLY_ACC=CAM_ASM_000658 /LENGTH=58 /DNA_ID=CAMNT_0015393571 /DNA_START=177 /DNA_END=350 /DNA_ORIENTATION=-
MDSVKAQCQAQVADETMIGHRHQPPITLSLPSVTRCDRRQLAHNRQRTTAAHRRVGGA